MDGVLVPLLVADDLCEVKLDIKDLVAVSGVSALSVRVESGFESRPKIQKGASRALMPFMKVEQSSEDVCTLACENMLVMLSTNPVNDKYSSCFIWMEANVAWYVCHKRSRATVPSFIRTEASVQPDARADWLFVKS